MSNLKAFKAFQKETCPVTGQLEELDPVYGFSLDGMASRIRRGELQVSLPWALHPEIGFETRFHGKRVSNITFRSLPQGFTRGSMLVNFGDDELWMRNLGKSSGTIEAAGDPVPNFWREFLRSALRDIQFVFQLGSDNEPEWFSFQVQAMVNSRWLSVRPPLAAGAVIDVPDSFSGHSKPCEIPVSFRDFDWLLTVQIQDSAPEDSRCGFLAKRYFKGYEHPRVYSFQEALNRIDNDLLQSYLSAGHGILGVLKGEQKRLGVQVSIPQLEIRELG